MAGVAGIALATVAVHLAVGWRYGFDRDELLALEDARHLAWGYVQYPPMTAFFGWVALKLFGTSLGGFRFFAAVVQAVALVLTGLMAKELARGAGKGKWKFEDEVPSGAEAPSGAGLNVAAEAAAHKAIGRDAALRKTAGQDEEGDAAREDGAVEILRVQRTHPQDDNGSRDAGERPEAERSQSFLVPGEPTRHSRWEPGEWAAVVATLAGVPFCLGAGALMQYISFDYVCWVVVAWGMVKLVTEEVASDEWRMASEEKSEDRNSKFEKRNSEGGGSLAVRAAHGKKPGVRGQESAEKEERFLASRAPRGMTGLRGGERGGGAFSEETSSGPPQKAVPTKARV